MGVLCELLPYYGFYHEWAVLMTSLNGSTRVTWNQHAKAFEVLGSRYVKRVKKELKASPVLTAKLLNPSLAKYWDVRVGWSQIAGKIALKYQFLDIIPDGHDLVFTRVKPGSNYRYKLQLEKCEYNEQEPHSDMRAFDLSMLTFYYHPWIDKLWGKLLLHKHGNEWFAFGKEHTPPHIFCSSAGVKSLESLLTKLALIDNSKFGYLQNVTIGPENLKIIRQFVEKHSLKPKWFKSITYWGLLGGSVLEEFVPFYKEAKEISERWNWRACIAVPHFAAVDIEWNTGVAVISSRYHFGPYCVSFDSLKVENKYIPFHTSSKDYFLFPLGNFVEMKNLKIVTNDDLIQEATDQEPSLNWPPQKDAIVFKKK